MWHNYLKVMKNGSYYVDIKLPLEMDVAEYMALDFEKRMPADEGFSITFLQFDAMAKEIDFRKGIRSLG